MRDPIVEEVRAIRDAYARKFDYDLHAICEDLRRKAKERGHQTVSHPPRRVEPGTPYRGPRPRRVRSADR